MSTKEERKQALIDKYGVNLSKLNIENVRKWVRAMRSGKFKQAIGYLHNPDEGSYCALGVAAKLGDPDPESLTNSVLSEKAMKWLGVESPDPMVGDEEVTNLNDDDELSLKQIATRVEKYWIKPWEKYKHCFPKKEANRAARR